MCMHLTPSFFWWERQDEVIPPGGFTGGAVPKLVASLPSAQFRWVEESGHTPHLECVPLTLTLTLTLTLILSAQPSLSSSPLPSS